MFVKVEWGEVEREKGICSDNVMMGGVRIGYVWVDRIHKGGVICVLPQVHVVIEEGAVEGDHSTPPHSWSIDRPQGAEVDGGEISELYSRSIQYTRDRNKDKRGGGEGWVIWRALLNGGVLIY